MKCPFCGNLETQVVETRVSEDADFIRRRRQCGACEKRFTTYERPDVNFPAIVKKDGRRIEYKRGKILGSIMAALSIAGIGFFMYGLFYVARQLPDSAAAPRVGQKAPDFTLPDQNDKPLTLAELLASPLAGAPTARANSALLIFYRGHW